MVYGVLGPRGTFSEEAALLYWGGRARLIEAASIPQLFDMVQSGEVAGALVPIDNSMAGSIEPTMEGLALNDIIIRGEICIPIQQHLMAVREYSLEEIELLISQPAALLQCEQFIRQNMSGVRTEITDSTTRAAQLLTVEKRRAAAIGNKQAAELYGLKIICSEISGKDNITRFVHITSGSVDIRGDKSSLIFSLPDRPGALWHALGVLARRNINMTKIESRPSRHQPSRFWFYVELDTTGLCSEMAGFLEELDTHCESLKYLGSYQSAALSSKALQ